MTRGAALVLSNKSRSNNTDNLLLLQLNPDLNIRLNQRREQHVSLDGTLTSSTLHARSESRRLECDFVDQKAIGQSNAVSCHVRIDHLQLHSPISYSVYHPSSPSRTPVYKFQVCMRKWSTLVIPCISTYFLDREKNLRCIILRLFPKTNSHGIMVDINNNAACNVPALPLLCS